MKVGDLVRLNPNFDRYLNSQNLTPNKDYRVNEIAKRFGATVPVLRITNNIEKETWIESYYFLPAESFKNKPMVIPLVLDLKDIIFEGDTVVAINSIKSNEWVSGL